MEYPQNGQFLWHFWCTRQHFFQDLCFWSFQAPWSNPIGSSLTILYWISTSWAKTLDLSWFSWWRCWPDGNSLDLCNPNRRKSSQWYVEILEYWQFDPRLMIVLAAYWRSFLIQFHLAVSSYFFFSYETWYYAIWVWFMFGSIFLRNQIKQNGEFEKEYIYLQEQRPTLINWIICIFTNALFSASENTRLIYEYFWLKFNIKICY